ncbi:MAG: sigma-54 dependent transcriptional regulator [Gammaproteobacteria bacterium]|nr:sigma-54-dependent Fis family transcriptional regulator [Pseudomonadales bacterium]MCP5349049.1 sigma-54-dependent Fis family transcriptional regulator [Pseudomonadales bacterium]
MTGEVLLIADEQEVITKTTALLESLDHLVSHLESSELIGSLSGRNPVLTALVALADRSAEKQAIAALRSEYPMLPIYLLRSDRDFFQETPETLEVSGSIRLPVRYGDLLEILKQARMKALQNRENENHAAGPRLIGTSPGIKAIRTLIRQVAATEASVLLSGESGTGKEVVARNIHALSLRADRPFVAVNCGAIPPELLESELFGHEKGAFTGAFQSRPGRFELAEGGTLFLDEIGDMPLNMQVKLLRVIQEKSFERVGGSRTRISNVRLIAATHQDLENQIAEGKFRLDLFYRLNVFPIELPALRDRSEDIPQLINAFIKARSGPTQEPISFAGDALQTLMNHPLPGNVRELENLVERLSILHPGETIDCAKLPVRYQQHGSLQSPLTELIRADQVREVAELPAANGQKINLKQYLASLERSLICRALEQSDWVVTRAAQTLSVRRTTLIEKIRKLEIRQPRGQQRSSVL